MDSIFIYFCIVYERFIVFASINFLKIFVDNLVLGNLWVMAGYNVFLSIKIC